MWKPKGLTIWRVTNSEGRFLRYEATVKSKGRTGAATREAYMRASQSTQQAALWAWVRKQSALNILRETPNG
jgi:hypothetical protein